ncbi:condensation domain-containing protein [Streptomyces sp. CMB-StM0423]|uniref:condensation domain-containing protein n=1 Tax=Streptomyces sp. CMB-StM0423 TaxID=2059884 RepID=UPI000C700A1C|nr:condensation domain-containing protein [Streptomyces sp. CMB-StM0423]AUH39369.1 ABC transporter ATP-binding protein [Streptomyces sp. CMB-StM0423]
MRTELSEVAGHTARVVTVGIAGAPAGRGPVTWGQWAIRRAMLDTEPDDHGTNVKVLVPVEPAVPAGRAAEAVRGLLTVYDALRTRVHVDGDGAMHQELDGGGTFGVHLFDADDTEAATALADAVERRWRAVRFAYDREWPVRAALVCVDGKAVRAVLVLAHVATDAMGLTLLHRALTELLRGADPAALRAASRGHQPLAEAGFQASEKGRKRDATARRHWVESLRDAPERLFARRPGADPRFRQAVLASPSLPGALRTLDEHWRISSSAILLAAASAVVARQSRHDRAVFQVMVSNRFQPALRDAVSTVTLEGLFTLDAGLEPGAGPAAFQALARRAAQAAMKTYYHAYYDKSALLADLRGLDERRGRPTDRTCWYNDLRDMITEARSVDRREHAGVRPEKSVIEWQTLGRQSETSVAWHVYSSRHFMPVSLTVDTGLIDEPAAEAMLTGFEALIVDAAAATETAETGRAAEAAEPRAGSAAGAGAPGRGRAARA